MIKLIVTDLDGTLLNEKKELTQITIDTLIEAQKQGIKIVLATGRNYQSLKPIYTKLKMDQFNTGAIVGVNGEETFYFENNEYEKIADLSANQAMYLLKKLSLMMFNVQLMNDLRIKDYCPKLLYFFKKIVFKIKHYNLDIGFEGIMKNHTYINRSTFIDHSINKVGIAQLDVYLSLMLPLVRYQLKDDYDVLKVSKGWAEIMPKGVNKGSGVLRVMEHYNILPKEVLVFGDGENDLSMFDVTSNSFAPENALKTVKKKANYHCPANYEDGVAKVVASYLLDQVTETH